MADKKLNEVTKVTDMAYVPVIMSDGSIGQIAKADLASVVAGKIGTDRFYKSLGTSLSDEQINIPFDGGDIFYSKIENSDSPDYYLIRSYRFGGASCYQEAINVSSFTKHVRVTRNDGVTWTEWVKV